MMLNGRIWQIPFCFDSHLKIIVSYCPCIMSENLDKEVRSECAGGHVFFFFPSDVNLVKIFLRNTEFKIIWFSPKW